MKIWFDLCHPPHVPFFAPQIRELNRRGHKSIVTIRDRFQVAELCDREKISYTKIGRDYGRSKIRKAGGIVKRTFELAVYAHSKQINLAVSQGSSYQVLAAFLLNIPSVFMTDYEHIFLGFANQFAKKIILPDVIPDKIILQKKIPLKKVIRYPGLKEHVYLKNFKPDSQIVKTLGLDLKKVIITLRPPARDAHYHNPISDELFSAVVSYLVMQPRSQLVILPRNLKEKNELQKQYPNEPGKIIIPPKTVYGLNLIFHSDLVISGGGTMNREAAVLNIPVYTIFRGKTGSMDRFLENEGRLIFIETANDIYKIIVEKKQNKRIDDQPTVNLKKFLVETLISLYK